MFNTRGGYSNRPIEVAHKQQHSCRDYERELSAVTKEIEELIAFYAPLRNFLKSEHLYKIEDYGAQGVLFGTMGSLGVLIDKMKGHQQNLVEKIREEEAAREKAKEKA